jgi:hypothetical protein
VVFNVLCTQSIVPCTQFIIKAKKISATATAPTYNNKQRSIHMNMNMNMNMNTSKEKAQQSSFLGFVGKGSSRKAIYDRMPRKDKVTEGSVDWAYFVKWRRVRIGDIVFRDVAASTLQPGEDIPTDATTLLSVALSSFDWFGVSYIMGELGVTEPPRTKEDRVAVAFHILSNRQQLYSSRNSHFYNGIVPNKVHCNGKGKAASAFEFGSASRVSSKSNTLSKSATNAAEVLAVANQ